MNLFYKKMALAVSVSLFFFCGCSAGEQWVEYLGGSGRNQYSPLEQIRRGNVNQLEVAWVYHTGDIGEMQCNPLIVNDRLFGVSAFGRLFSLDAKTGEELWTYFPADIELRKRTMRGVTYWTDNEEERIFFTIDSGIFAVDARTGEPIKGFGEDGRVELRNGLGQLAGEKWIFVTTPGALYEDTIIMPLRTSESGTNSALGYVLAFDVRTGELRWTFRTIPSPGEFGYETWPPDAHKNMGIGGANSWAGMAVDKERGIVYVPTGSAAPDFWGGSRVGSNLFANCLIALDAQTGQRIWHYQFVHHDLWDRDLPAPPNLVDIEKNDVKIAAVAQVTKSGHVFLFDRETGEPVYPIEEIDVPASEIQGEVSWPTQPLPTWPLPFARQTLNESDFSPYVENKERIQDIIRNARKGQFEPFGMYDTLLFPGFDGGAEWGGAAVDPSGVLYVNANEMAWLARLTQTPQDSDLMGLSPGKKVYAQFCVACHGQEQAGDGSGRVPSLVDIGQRMKREEITQIVRAGRGMMPGFPVLSEADREAVADFILGREKTEGPSSVESDSSYSTQVVPPYKLDGYRRFVDRKGYPAISPPWGTLTAIDLNSGEHLWQVPLGNVDEYANPDESPTGIENYGGPVVTRSGLLFIAATKDGMFRVFDKKDGSLLWEVELPAPGYATPSVYDVDGKQFVVVAAGGTKLGSKRGDSFIAFTLGDE